ncbi:Tm-1-like ATP-binding domain-containing protein [Actinotignum urinale]|uniref:Tm-1-like ATP-binding domain-containing protein n=1 Tax=Actinotignum urinale TaxID=190146 RepID=UPI002A7ED0A6|nr:Tm-1-like ATP-binding domain-containing protein [Actinotignum urinale]MDY5151299.1 Tm-1-like ATP-binding domain-containing protein [Actinotignum urinale]
MATVLVQGTLDTKGEELLWMKSELEKLGIQVILLDVGSFSDAPEADITAHDVTKAVGEDLDQLRLEKDRGKIMTIMGEGSAKIVTGLLEEGKIHGFLSAGGSGGSSVAAAAIQALPVGFPKVLVSTMASGNVKPYVGGVDATLMYSVVDVAGINSISSAILGNAVAAIAGMAERFKEEQNLSSQEHKPVIAISMFGLTTPAAYEARETLMKLGYETLVFHATGAGGMSMEKLVESGLVAGVCDITTTELCDELAGGVLSAGPHRLEAAAREGVPQVVSFGAVDMVNFGPKNDVPEKYAERNFIVHNPTVTLMRTTVKENQHVGAEIGKKISVSTGPVALFIPEKGFSGIDEEGGPFWDPEADKAAIDAALAAVEGSGVEVIKISEHINAPGFGAAMAQKLHELITQNEK